jgi:transposase InsO family protein
VFHCLADLIVAHGTPEHIRSDNGPEFVARNVRQWLGRIGVKTLFIELGSSWENGYRESFNSKLRDAFLAWLSTAGARDDLQCQCRWPLSANITIPVRSPCSRRSALIYNCELRSGQAKQRESPKLNTLLTFRVTLVSPLVDVRCCHLLGHGE